MIKRIFVILVILWGCSEQTPVTKTSSPSAISEIDPVVKRILTAGFKKENIVEFDDRYLVEGDIVFYKKDPTPSKGLSMGRTEQARTDFLIGPAYYHINIYLNTESFAILKLDEPLNHAIAAYNSLRGSQIRMSRVYSAEEANIVIVNEDVSATGWGLCAVTAFPFSDGRPGDKVSFDENFVNSHVQANFHPEIITYLLVHELGHSIGLRHTNWQELGEDPATTIPGTPDGNVPSDLTSVMTGGLCGAYFLESQGFGGFSMYDCAAITNLYPQSGNWILSRNQELHQNQFLISQDKRFVLYLQDDGNLVLFYYNKVIWKTDTGGNPSITRLRMQSDANLVLYDTNTRAWWATNTSLSWAAPAFLYLQNDGNLVLYQGNYLVRWASNTCCY